jgi:hypothetical protein
MTGCAVAIVEDSNLEIRDEKRRPGDTGAPLLKSLNVDEI